LLNNGKIVKIQLVACLMSVVLWYPIQSYVEQSLEEYLLNLCMSKQIQLWTPLEAQLAITWQLIQVQSSLSFVAHSPWCPNWFWLDAPP